MRREMYKGMFFLGLGGTAVTVLLLILFETVSVVSWIWGGMCFGSLVISLIQKVRKEW